MHRFARLYILLLITRSRCLQSFHDSLCYRRQRSTVSKRRLSVVGSRNLVLIFLTLARRHSLWQRTNARKFSLVIFLRSSFDTYQIVLLPSFRRALYFTMQLIPERLCYSPNIIFCKNPRLGKILPSLPLADIFFKKRELGLMNFPRTNLCFRRICWKPVVELKPKSKQMV